MDKSLLSRRNANIVEKRITHRLAETVQTASDKAVELGYTRYEVGKIQAKVNQQTADQLLPTRRAETNRNVEVIAASCSSVGVGGALELLQALGTLIGETTTPETDPDETVRELERYVVREIGRKRMRASRQKMEESHDTKIERGPDLV